MADPGWVEMRHPSGDPEGDPAVVTEAAYEGMWKDKGWKKVGDTSAPAMRRSSTEGDK